MMQTKKDKAPDVFASNFYLNLFDKMTTVDNGVLMTITSQLTGKTKNFLSIVTFYTSKERWVLMLVNVNTTETPSSGKIILGTTYFPYGMYDVKIYQNDPSTATNLDPDNAIKLLYTGLMNLEAKSGNEAIDYK